MSFWIVSLFVYVGIAIVWSLVVPFKIAPRHDGHDEPDMCPECKLRPAPPWMRVVGGFLWPVISILTVALLMVQLVTGGRR